MNYKLIEIKKINIERYFDLDEYNNTYAVNNIITKLLEYNKFPIKNKRIAIENILQFLIYIEQRRKDKKETLLSINYTIFQKYFGTRLYTNYINILKELNIIHRVSYDDNTFYKKGEYSSLYRISNEYINDDAIYLFIIKDKNNIQYENNLSIKIDKKMIDTIYKAEIDTQKAIEAEVNNAIINSNFESLKYRLNTILMLNNKRYIKNGEKVDRIYHSFSNVSKISRQYITINDKQFKNIDIVNCQPLLLCYLLADKNMKIDDEYIKDCENGIFYERFMNNNNTKRDDIKVKLYTNIFFNFIEDSVISENFKLIYPNTFESLKILNENNENTMASMLQNIEAKIFNDIKIKGKYYFTLFDAIYYTDDKDTNYIINQIKNEFKNKNINVTLKIS